MGGKSVELISLKRVGWKWPSFFKTLSCSRLTFWASMVCLLIFLVFFSVNLQRSHSDWGNDVMWRESNCFIFLNKNNIFLTNVNLFTKLKKSNFIFGFEFWEIFNWIIHSFELFDYTLCLIINSWRNYFAREFSKTWPYVTSK